jgi:hypothetical protein
MLRIIITIPTVVRLLPSSFALGRNRAAILFARRFFYCARTLARRSISGSSVFLRPTMLVKGVVPISPLVMPTSTPNSLCAMQSVAAAPIRVASSLSKTPCAPPRRRPRSTEFQIIILCWRRTGSKVSVRMARSRSKPRSTVCRFAPGETVFPCCAPRVLSDPKGSVCLNCFTTGPMRVGISRFSGQGKTYINC